MDRFRVSRFTEKYLASLSGQPARYTAREDATVGLGLRVHPTGRKTWVYIYKNPDGKVDVMTLGRYPTDLSLAEARKECERWHKVRRKGLDPKRERERQELEAKREQREQDANRAAESRLGTVSQLFDAYVKDLESRGKRTHGEIRRALNHDADPLIGEMHAKDILPGDIKRVLKRVAQRGSLVQANRVRSYMSAAFKYGIYHDNDIHRGDGDTLFGLEFNPVRDVPKALRDEKPGERDLTAAEIKTLWKGLTELSPKDINIQSEIALKLLLATGGQRSGEVIGARWEEFDRTNHRWEIPGARTKNGKPHVIPLGSIALELLERLHTITGEDTFLFPIRTIGKEKPQPVTSLNQAVRKVCAHCSLEKFTPRDLRRTCKSRMGELGISKEIRDRIHNHAFSDVSSKHYDRYMYLPEKRDAIERWDTKLQEVISGKAETFERKVVQFTKRKAPAEAGA